MEWDIGHQKLCQKNIGLNYKNYQFIKKDDIMSEFSKTKEEMQINRDSLKKLLRKRNIYFEE